MSKLITLAVETSCDETAASVLRGRWTPLSSIVASQNDLHSQYGGVVPELACRRHAEVIRPIVHEALKQAGVTLDNIDLVAATRGPGLVGALLVGLSYAKALAWARKLPFVGVNHLDGHVAAAFVENPDTPTPALALLVSGGHTELFMVNKPGDMRRLGGTRDDAAGEAFDKVAKMLGLGYPGGPIVEQRAREGSAVFDVPVALMDHNILDFSFSGPKTAVKYIVQNLVRDGKEIPVANVCASFQKSLVTALTRKTLLAVERYAPASILLSGGVACNGALREAFVELGVKTGLPVIIPRPSLCSDNAVMIAAAAANRYLDAPDDPAFRDYMELDADPGWMP